MHMLDTQMRHLFTVNIDWIVDTLININAKTRWTNDIEDKGYLQFNFVYQEKLLENVGVLSTISLCPVI